MSDVVYDLAEPIVAYRSWRTFHPYDKPPELAPISFDTPWTREMTAAPCQSSGPYFMGRAVTTGPPPCDGPPCSGRRHGIIGYGCGLYAVKKLSTALIELNTGVLGKVLLGGKVWDHELGYRAEKAQIVGLYGQPAFDRYERYVEWRPLLTSLWIYELCKAYEIPVITEVTEEEHADLVGVLEEHWVMTRLGVIL